MQIKDEYNPWSSPASSRLLRCFITDAVSHKAIIYQFDSTHAFIQLDMKNRMFVILDKGYENSVEIKKRFLEDLLDQKDVYMVET